MTLRESNYCESLTIIIVVMKNLGGHYFQDWVNNRQGYKKGKGGKHKDICIALSTNIIIWFPNVNLYVHKG